MSHWTLLDFVFAGIIAISIVLALTKGLMREIVSLAALIGGFFLAVMYYPAAAGLFREFSRTDSVANFLGFLLIFLGCLLLGAVIAFLVNRFIKATSLKWVDRLLGGVFGLLRGWAICSIIALGLIAFPVKEGLMARSVLAPFMLAGARAAVLMTPQTLKDTFHEQYQKALRSWNQTRSAS